MTLELITDPETLSQGFSLPEEGMTGGGTGGRDLDRSDNAEAEC